VSFAQSLSGKIVNEQQEGIPFANIFFRELGTGTSSSDQGIYHITVDPGEYHIVISAVGYDSRSLVVKVDDQDTKDIVLKVSDNKLNEVLIKASKKDPAFEIISNVIDNKPKFQSQFNTLSSKVYIKAKETRESDLVEKDRKSKRKKIESTDLETDPFEEMEKKRKAEMSKLSLLEMQLNLHQKYPNKYKEERTAYKAYGSKEGLYIPRFDEADFNFYDNMVFARSIIETPIVSPFSKTAIITYKYKLISSEKEDEQLVHKIKVIPRKKGNSNCYGYVYINDETWNINRLELNLQKGSAKIFDEFKISQSYAIIEDKYWIVDRIQFDYQTKAGKKENYTGSTTIRFEDYMINPSYSDNYFNNEISSITQEAYDRDSIYWNQNRPEKLTMKERDFVTYTDSVNLVLNSKEYKDSVQHDFNRIEILDLIWDGLGFQYHERKEQLWFNPLTALWNFEVVGGFRVGAFGSYSRKFKDERFYRNFNQLHVGLKNKDLLGSTSHRFRYDPFHSGDIFFYYGKGFEPINEFDAYLNQLRASNYFLNDEIAFEHVREIVNGLFINTGISWNDRQTINGLETASFLNELFEEEEPVLVFEPYTAAITTIQFSYTPAQQYMREPNRKVNLGSKFPTFHLKHVKGWNNFLSSDIDFDYVEFEVEQDLILGVLGNTRYTAKTGTFVNTKKLEFIDLKRFRESDPILYSPPLQSFQLLDTSLQTSKPFIETHIIHHFNGALINNIPLLKLSKISTVIGGGFLWVQEEDYRHQEIFAGIERIIKLGPRRRLRVGIYGVLADSNKTATDTTWKISLDIIDTWDRDWSF